MSKQVPAEVDRSWHAKGACYDSEDPDLWFPENGGNALSVKAKELCNSCIVRKLCLLQAIQNGEQHGIWGGFNTVERRVIARSWNRRSNTNANKSDANDGRSVGRNGRADRSLGERTA